MNKNIGVSILGGGEFRKKKMNGNRVYKINCLS